MIDVIYDMETQDPDDFFTLCLLVAHPKVKLRAVTLTPGTDAQVGIARYLLEKADVNIPVGGRENKQSSCVSQWHYNFLGQVPAKSGWRRSADVIVDTLKEFPEATILTGGPLTNLGEALDKGAKIKRWVAQGGFAGDNVVPPENRLPKFAGMIACQTFNFNGNLKAAKQALSSPNIEKRILVSKNVCHGVVYDKTMHEFFKRNRPASIGYDYIFNGMEYYLERNPSGKKFHDPLAACVAIDDSICQFAEVELFHNRDGWSSGLTPGSNTKISVGVDMPRFVDVLVAK